MFRDNQPHKNIQQILSQYHTLAASYPEIMRLLIPANEVWRFFVDGVDVETKGETLVSYENREPGYIKSMYACYNEFFNLKESITVDSIKKLHRLALSDVKTDIYIKDNLRSTPGSYRFQHEKAWFGISDATKAGLKKIISRPWDRVKMPSILLVMPGEKFEFDLTAPMITALREEIPQRKHWHQNKLTDYLCELLGLESRETMNSFTVFLKEIGLTKDDDELTELFYQVNQSHLKKGNGLHLAFAADFPKVSEALLEEILAFYLERFTLAPKKGPLQILSAIVELIQSCEQQHPFADGNTRTFTMSLTNKLLLRHGFPPAILQDPNRFGHWSSDELVDELIKGMQNTLELVTKNKLHQVKTDDIQLPAKHTRLFKKVFEQEEKQHERKKLKLS